MEPMEHYFFQLTMNLKKSNPYLSDYQIVNGNKFSEINGFIGKRVEIIGKVVDVREGKSQFGLDRRLRPYTYLDMDELKEGKLFRIKFLPDIAPVHVARIIELV